MKTLYSVQKNEIIEMERTQPDKIQINDEQPKIPLSSQSIAGSRAQVYSRHQAGLVRQDSSPEIGTPSVDYDETKDSKSLCIWLSAVNLSDKKQSQQDVKKK